MLSSPIQPPLPGSNRSWFMAIAIIAFIFVAGFSIYSGLQKAGLQKDLKSLQVKKEALATPSVTLKNSPTDAAISVLAAKNALRNMETRQLQWAKVIEKIETTVPKTKDTNEPIVGFKSYNGTEDGKISVSGVTRGSAVDAFADVALLIRTFANEPAFKKVFVPTITKALTPEGMTVLSFSINFAYSKQTF